MAVFKQRDDEPAIEHSGGDRVNTIIGKDTTFNGTLEVAGTLRVDGILKGQVNVTDTVAVGPTGQVDANVKTKNAVISGSVKGNIHATEKVELQAKANITGDLTTKALVIEQGAVFHGNCNMNPGGAQQPSAGTNQRTEANRPTGQPKAQLETTEKVR
jgi:cytoskeletal protein CcmA (bactofilin family)